tara:strand:+ start:3246 stop:3455 length:210 start_codon:yes stop_codon:yes gene_type:complete
MEFYKDLIERSTLTGIQAFMGMMVVDQTLGMDASVLKMAVASGIGAALSVVKSGVASRLGVGTASLADR